MNCESFQSLQIKLVNLSMFNCLFPFLQVIRIPSTSDDTFNKLLDFGQAMGKTTVQCKVMSFMWLYYIKVFAQYMKIFSLKNFS